MWIFVIFLSFFFFFQIWSKLHLEEGLKSDPKQISTDASQPECCCHSNRISEWVWRHLEHNIRSWKMEVHQRGWEESMNSLTVHELSRVRSLTASCPGWQVCPKATSQPYTVWTLLDQLLSNPQRHVGAESSSSCRWSGGCLPDQTKRGATSCPGPHVITPTTKNTSEQRRTGCQARRGGGEKKSNSASLSLYPPLSVSRSVPGFCLFPTLSISLYLPFFLLYTHINNEAQQHKLPPLHMNQLALRASAHAHTHTHTHTQWIPTQKQQQQQRLQESRRFLWSTKVRGDRLM